MQGESPQSAIKQAKAGRWVGVKSGMFACHDNSIKTEAGYVTVDYVEYK